MRFAGESQSYSSSNIIYWSRGVLLTIVAGPLRADHQQNHFPRLVRRRRRLLHKEKLWACEAFC